MLSWTLLIKIKSRFFLISENKESGSIPGSLKNKDVSELWLNTRKKIEIKVIAEGKLWTALQDLGEPS